MFYSKGMFHLGFPLANNKVEGDDDDNYGDSTPFSFFLASNHAALHHTRRHHHEQRGKAMNMGKTERGEEFQPVFGEERRGSTKTCPSFPSLPLPLPSLFFHAREWWRTEGRRLRVWKRGGFGTVAKVTVARVLCRGPCVQQVKKIITFLSKLQTRHVDSQTEYTRRALRNHSVRSSTRAMDPKS